MPLDENPTGQPVSEIKGEKLSVRVLLDVSLGLLVMFLVGRLMVSGIGQEACAPSVNKVIELFPALALVFWILAALSAGRVRFERTGVRIPILIFIALTVLSVAQASYALAAAQTAGTWVVHVCVFFLVINLGSDRRRYNVILTAVIATVAVVAILSFYHYFHDLRQARELYEKDPSVVVVPENLRHEFADRLNLDEETGTFIQSNTFSGYLIMVVPLVLFLTYGAIRRWRAESNIGPAVLLLASAAGAGALYLAGSKGGYAGLLGGILLFCGFYYLHKRPPDKLRKARLNAIVVIVAVVILFVALMMAVGYDSLPASVRVRLGYWDAAMRMIWHNPLGVGLANFQEHYPVHQQAWATEVRSAHNSYLSIWCELSIAGLAAFVAILFLSGKRYLSALKRGSDNPGAEAAQDGDWKLYLSMLLAGAGGFAAVSLLGRFSQIPLAEPGRSLLAFATVLWVALAAGLLLSQKVLSRSLASAGIALGLLAFVCHAFIDFDFYSHGVNATFWVLLGLLLCHCCRLEGSAGKAPSRFSRLGVAAVVLIMAVVVLFGVVYVPHSLNADAQSRTARTLGEDAVRAGYDPALALGAAEEFEKAQKLGPWNAENYRWAAELYEHVFFKTGNPVFAYSAIENYSGVLKLRGNSYNAYAHRGHVRLYKSKGKDREEVAGAVADFEKAAQLYPVNATNHYRLALCLLVLARLSEPNEARKLGARARAQFEEALRLHKTVAFARGRLSEAHANDVKRRLGHE